MRPFVSVTGLRKSYGAHRVLDGIDLSIPQGTVFSLLGPNGAGKTTTVQIFGTGVDALRELLERLDAQAIDVAELSVHKPDLDDVFLALTEESSR